MPTLLLLYNFLHNRRIENELLDARACIDTKFLFLSAERGPRHLAADEKKKNHIGNVIFPA